MKPLAHQEFCTECPVCGTCAIPKAETLPAIARPLELVRYGAVKTYRSGAYILHQDSTPPRAPMICRGLIAVMVSTESGEEILLNVLGPGQIVGLPDWLQRTHTSSVSAKAVTDVAMRFVTVGDPLTLLRQSQATRAAFLEHIGARIRADQRAMINLRSAHAYARTLFAIHELVRLLHLKRERPVIIPHKIPRWFFSSYTGLRPETVSRVLTRLKREGLIAYQNRQLVIPKLDRLTRDISHYSSFLIE